LSRRHARIVTGSGGSGLPLGLGCAAERFATSTTWRAAGSPSSLDREEVPVPWPHCGQAIRDDLSCPTCGVSKEEWSIKFNVTRAFTVGGRPACKVVLLDEADGFVADEPCVMRLPDGSELSQALNEVGYLKGTTKIPGMVEVRFPGRPGAVTCSHPAVEQ